MRTRVLTAVALGPFVVYAMARGGWWYTAVVLIVLSIGAVEWVQLAAQGGQSVSGGLVLLLVWLFLADRLTPNTEVLAPGLTLLLVASLGWAIIRYRQGDIRSMVGFAFTLSGGLYLGWLGGHFVALRTLPEGGWWTALAIPAVWVADTAAYLIGRRWGRTRLMPDVSPKKTVEGYVASIVGGALGTAGLAWVWHALGAGPAITPLHGAALGLLAGTVGPVGDLGISTLKRQVGAKDSGSLLPGHGGFLDRLDAVIVTVPLGYYYIVRFAL